MEQQVLETTLSSAKQVTGRAIITFLKLYTTSYRNGCILLGCSPVARNALHNRGHRNADILDRIARSASLRADQTTT